MKNVKKRTGRPGNEARENVAAIDFLIFGQGDGLGPRAMNRDGLPSGSTVQTALDPAVSHTWTFSSTSSARSFGESTSTARSGAKGMCFSGFG